MVGLENLRAAHAGGVVVCFSHADPIKAAVAHALGMHLDLFQRIVISPASVSAISYVDGQAPSVLMVNLTSEPLAGLVATWRPACPRLAAARQGTPGVHA